MEKCLYFAKKLKNLNEADALAPGFGFTAKGDWRGRPLPSDEIGLIVDDCFLPSRLGLDAACRALAEWKGLIVLDFERPPSQLLIALAHSLTEKQTVLPPSYSACPHAAVLVGPWQAELGFSHWLQNLQTRFGRVVLDCAPLRVQCCPGGKRRPWASKLPESGFFCPALGCFHRRLPDGTIIFWDSRRTFHARLESIEAPVILVRSDWEALPTEKPEQF